MIIYYVDSFSGWFVVQTRNKRRARAVGVEEFGHGAVKVVRRATKKEITQYVENKGLQAIYD